MKPTSAPAHFPYAHRTIEQVDHDERLARALNLLSARWKNDKKNLPVNPEFARERADRIGACNTAPALTDNALEVR